MTATPTRPATRGNRQRPFGQWPVGERSLVTSVLGIPPLGAVGLAFGFTTLGLFVDLQRIGTVGTVFSVLYLAGCVLAIAWVRRRSLFAPMVQPPLLVAVAVPVIVLLGDGAGAGGAALLTVAAPLVNSFPTMAGTTGLVLVVGLFRLVVQRDRARGGRRPARPDRPRTRTQAGARARTWSD